MKPPPREQTANRSLVRTRQPFHLLPQTALPSRIFRPQRLLSGNVQDERDNQIPSGFPTDPVPSRKHLPTSFCSVCGFSRADSQLPIRDVLQNEVTANMQSQNCFEAAFGFLWARVSTLAKGD